MTIYLGYSRNDDTTRVDLVGERTSPPFISLISLGRGRLSFCICTFVVYDDSFSRVGRFMVFGSIYLRVYLVSTRLGNIFLPIVVYGFRSYLLRFPSIR